MIDKEIINSAKLRTIGTGMLAMLMFLPETFWSIINSLLNVLLNEKF